MLLFLLRMCLTCVMGASPMNIERQYKTGSQDTVKFEVY